MIGDPVRARGAGFADRALIALAVAAVVLHLLPLLGVVGPLWGTHAFAFLPGAAAWSLTAALLVVAVLLRRGFHPLGALRTSLPPRLGWALAVSLSFSAFWVFRARHTLLGDGIPITIELAGSDARFHPREPLSFALQRVAHDLLLPLLTGWRLEPLRAAETTAALLSVLAGVASVPVMVGIAREAARAAAGADSPRADRPGRPARADTTPVAVVLGAGILLAQGYVQLFFGYVECYGLLALAIALNLWLGLRFLNGRGPLVLALSAGVLALFVHLSAAVLFPSLALLVAWSWRAAKRRETLRDLAVAAALFLALAAGMRRLEPGYNVVASLLQVGGWAVTRQEERDPGYLWTGVHFRDFVNEQALIGPLALFLFLPLAARAGWRREGGMAGLYLAAAAVPFAVVSFLAGDSNLGYARNWDLLAPAGIVYTAGALFFAYRAAPSRGFYALALALSLYHTVPWILLNASEPRSLARIAALPLGGGRPEALIATWHWNRGELDEAAAWSRKALAANPESHVALRNLALIAMAKRDFAGAADAFARATAVRSDQPEYRRGFARAQLARETADGVREALESLPPVRSDADLWVALGDREADGADPAAGLTAYEKAVALDSLCYAAQMKTGLALAGSERPAEALLRFQSATRLRDDPTAWFNLGLAHANLGQIEAARRALKEGRNRCSDPALSARIDDLLATLTPR
jgi:tetratricopeptide (TPR) repeat protein